MNPENLKTPNPEKELEKKLLDTVLEVAGDNESMIRDGIIKALCDVNDKGRRVYLGNILRGRAEKKIRDARQKVGV